MNAAGPFAKRIREFVLPIRKVGPCDRLALGGDQLQPAVGGLRDAEDRHRPAPHLELDREPGARLAVVELERAQHGPLVGDRDVARAVVAHQHELLVEVERVELGVGAARAEPVHQQHRDVRLQVALARGRDAARGEQRVADDQPGRDPLVDVAADAAVVVGERRRARSPRRAGRGPTATRADHSKRSGVISPAIGSTPGRRGRTARGSRRPCARSPPRPPPRPARRGRRSRAPRRARRSARAPA